MFWLGLATVIALTLLALAAGLAVCVRARFAGRAERATMLTLAWTTLILTPIYGLGFANKLTATSLGITSTLLSSAVLVLAGRGIWGELPGAAWGLFRLPFDGLAMTWRARSLAFLGLAVAGGMIAWATLCSYWLPTWRGWDGPWYHEPIIAWTIQNHGLRIVPMPTGGQKVNGYPKAAELTALWFTIFTDRRLVDLASCLVAPPLMLSMYVIARRYTDSAVTAIGWACALALMPAATQELQSNYIDVNFAWILLVTAALATRPVFRIRDALFCSVAATILIGTKGPALVPAPLLLVIALVRLIRQNRGRGRALTGTILFGATIFLAMTCSIYLRNWLVFHNPFWPDLKVDIDKWNIHWPGSLPMGEHAIGREATDMNQEWGPFLGDATSEPYSWHRWHYGEVHDFGFGVPWLVWPLTAFSLMAIFFSLGRSAIEEIFTLRLPRWRAGTETPNVALLMIPMLAMFVLSPARWSARYHIGTTGLMMAVCAWAAGRKGFARLGEGVTAVVIVGGILGNFWGERWWVWPSELATIAKIPYPDREVTPAAAFTTASITTGSCTTREAGLARVKEMKKGDILAFPDGYGNFEGLFWNDQYSNKVVWVPEGPAFIANAEALGAKWIYLTHGDPNVSQMARAGWQEIAPLNVENWGSVYHRAPK